MPNYLLEDRRDEKWKMKKNDSKSINKRQIY
jgi:hypothetical protein